VFDETKVENLHLTALIDHDVRGFDIAVHDAVFMSLTQGLSDRRDDLNRAKHGQAVVQGSAESHALHIFHHDKRLAFASFAIVVNGGNVWMA